MFPTQIHQNPACACKLTVKKGVRRNRLQTLQVFRCTECLHRFTGTAGKNKSYPLKLILEAISTFNLGYSLTETQQLLRQRFHRQIPERTISSWLTEYRPLTTYARLRTAGRKLRPNDSVSMGNRGAAYGRSGENERALEDYNQALKLDSANAWLYLGRGVTYEHLSQYENAIRDFDEAIRLNPNLTEASTARQDAQARMRPAAANDDASSTTPDSVATATDGETSRSGEGIPPQNQVRSEFPDCYSGTWHENELNQFTWSFRRLGNYLRIRRNDGFVSGQFQKSPEGWIGFLNWGNGTTWNGVVLHDANETCDEITTNQRWWYKR